MPHKQKLVKLRSIDATHDTTDNSIIKFHLTNSKVLSKVVSVSLLQASIPNNFYNIRGDYAILDLALPNLTYITIPEGNYSLTTLLARLSYELTVAYQAANAGRTDEFLFTVNGRPVNTGASPPEPTDAVFKVYASVTRPGGGTPQALGIAFSAFHNAQVLNQLPTKLHPHLQDILGFGLGANQTAASGNNFYFDDVPYINTLPYFNIFADFCHHTVISSTRSSLNHIVRMPSSTFSNVAQYENTTAELNTIVFEYPRSINTVELKIIDDFDNILPMDLNEEYSIVFKFTYEE